MTEIVKRGYLKVPTQPKDFGLQATGLVFKSYDSQIALEFNVAQQDGTPADLLGANLRLLMFIYDEVDGTVTKEPIPFITKNLITESFLNGRVTYILPEAMKAYNGMVEAYVYIEYPDGSTSDNLGFTFRMKRSAIDGLAQDKADYFIEDFKQLLDGVKQEATDAVNEALAKVDSSTAKMQELEQRIDEQTEIFNDADVYNKAEIEDKLEPLAQMGTEIGQTRLHSSNKRKRALVSFICDDGAISDKQKLLNIVKDTGVPISLAIITDWVGTYTMNTQFMTWEEIKEFSDLGCEILSHTTQQQHLKQLSDSGLEDAMKRSRDVLRSKGYRSDLIAYPYGEQDLRVRNVAKKYYRGGFGIAGSNAEYGSNAGHLWSFNIARVGMGSNFDPVNPKYPSDTSSLDYYKARVDDAKNNASWVVFMLHTSGVMNPTQQQHLRDLIAYIKSQGIDIVTPSQALDEVGNVVEVGDIETGYLKVDSTGYVTSTNNQFVDSMKVNKANEFDFQASPIVLPRLNSITPITNAFASTAPLAPTTKGGKLFTYNLRTISLDFVHQEYVAVDGQRWQRFLSDTVTPTWGAWEELTRKRNLQTTLDTVTVPANGTVNVVYTNTQFKNSSIVSAYPSANIETGILYESFVVNNKDLVIRFANVTNVDIIVASKTWNINVV
ncbi:TPA: polysaccharide deacetylase family protein [Enterococcus faecium]